MLIIIIDLFKNKKSPREGPICSRLRGENEHFYAKFEPETDASQILSRYRRSNADEDQCFQPYGNAVIIIESI